MYVICYCFTQGCTRNSAQRKRGILSEIETAIKKSAWSWNQRQSSTKWGKICAEVSYETWRIQQSLLTGRSLPSIPREVNDIAVSSQFCDNGITKYLLPYKYIPVEEDYQTRKHSSCRLNCSLIANVDYKKTPILILGNQFLLSGEN